MSNTAQRIADLHRGLTNQPPTLEQVERIELIRSCAKALGTAILENTEHCRDQSIAITSLEDTTMRAVRAIVLEQPTPTAGTVTLRPGTPI